MQREKAQLEQEKVRQEQLLQSTSKEAAVPPGTEKMEVQTSESQTEITAGAMSAQAAKEQMEVEKQCDSSSQLDFQQEQVLKTHILKQIKDLQYLTDIGGEHQLIAEVRWELENSQRHLRDMRNAKLGINPGMTIAQCQDLLLKGEQNLKLVAIKEELQYVDDALIHLQNEREEAIKRNQRIVQMNAQKAAATRAGKPANF